MPTCRAPKGRAGLRPKVGTAPHQGAPKRGTALLATLAMAQFMVVLDFTIVNVALPSIQHGLHVATPMLQWLVSAYAVTFGGFLLLGGRLADVFGRARLYRIGLCMISVVDPESCHMLITMEVASRASAGLVGTVGPSAQITHAPLRMTVRPARSSSSRHTWMRSGPNTR